MLIWNIIKVAIKRLWAERGLTIAAAFGLVVGVALTVSIPLYADAVYFRILRETIVGEDSALKATPLAYRFRYTGARDGALQLEDVNALNSFLYSDGFTTLDMPRFGYVYHYKTDIYKVFLPGSPQNAKALTFLSLGIVSDPESHVRILEGRLPAENGADKGIIEVAIHEAVALEYGWQIGEIYELRRKDQKVVVHVTGIWLPVNRLDTFWSTPLSEVALISEDVFTQQLSPVMLDEIYLALWQLVVDGSNLHVADVTDVLTRTNLLDSRAQDILPKAVMDISPVKQLQDYQRGVPELTFQLLAFSLPIVILLLTFIGLVIGLYVDRQRNQIAVLRSRGASKTQVVSLSVIEGLTLGSIGLGVGAILAMVITRLIGQSRSFLDFSAPPSLRINMTDQGWWVGLAAILVAILALILPTLAAAGHTVLTYKQERARMLRSAWWQRFWLDFLLLIPTGYGFIVLRNQGSLAGEGGKAVNDLFQNPILFLTPVFGLFALTLFLARVMPLVMKITAWITSRTNSIGLLLASRQLARAPGMFTSPLILLTLTLSLSTFTASLAETLDNHLTKQSYYLTGADLILNEDGLATGSSSNLTGTRWLFKPVESHLTIPGILGATRVGKYPATIMVEPARVGILAGIDRLEFPKVAYWQKDFAVESLGALMNALAMQRDGVLLPREFMISYNLNIGDPITIAVTPYNDTIRLSLVVVGSFDLFPTWYPETGPIFVTNLDYLFETAGIEYPYQVWCKTNPSSDPYMIVANVKGLTALLEPGVDTTRVVENGLNILVSDWRSASLTISSEQKRPQRQGLFGLLSVGFIASAILTVLGFVLYALFSFRRRFIELGVLRAVGLSTKQMMILLAWELASIVLVGMLAGTILGLWISSWFIPYLQVGVEATSRIPPFVVQIAWGAILRIYFIFGILFFGALGGLSVMLVRMKIFQAVKLGETT